MKNLFRFTLLIWAACGLTSVASCQNKDSKADNNTLRVVIIRHGEKPDKGNNLSCQGFNRSLQLSKVLYSKFGVASVVYVPKIGSGDKTKSARMFQTISPYAVKYNLTINSSYDENDYKDVVKDVMQRTGTVVMVWEHNTIPELAYAFGVKDDLKWHGDDFDSIWVLTFKKHKALVTVDKEGITPQAGCSF